MALKQEKNLVDYFTERPRKELYLIYTVGNLDSEDSYMSEIGRRLASKLNITEDSGRQLIDRKLDEMVSQGLIETEKNGKKFVELTERGNQILDIIAPLFVEDKKEKVRETLKEVMRNESRGNELLETLNEDKFDTIKEKVWRKVDIELEKEELEKYVNAVWDDCKKEVEGEKWKKRNENSEKLLDSDS